MKDATENLSRTKVSEKSSYHVKGLVHSLGTHRRNSIIDGIPITDRIIVVPSKDVF